MNYKCKVCGNTSGEDHSCVLKLKKILKHISDLIGSVEEQPKSEINKDLARTHDEAISEIYSVVDNLDIGGEDE